MESFTLQASDGAAVACYSWLVAEPKAVIHIAHGMGEHGQRYDATATALNAAGYSVYANDHRGHGVTGQTNLGYMGADGWNRVLADAYEINRYIAHMHIDKAIILLGHSMGSMMSQQYITRYGASISALVLSGSPGFKAKFPGLLSGLIARFERWRLGADQPSNLLQRMLFGDANKPFDVPAASGFEWLSRDAVEVQKYIDDEACGFVLANGSLVDLFAGSAITQDADNLANIPKNLPIYIFSGADDPVHGERKDIQRMLQAFYDQQLNRITVKWYEGGRHEMFNETNRAEVVADVVAWLNARIVERNDTVAHELEV